jgi:tetratricopeptide (TPR) repeat protein
MNVLVAAAGLMLAVQANPDALSESATKLAQQQRYDEAAALWTEALKSSPAHFPSLFNFAFMRYSQKRFADAEPLLARAANSRPNDFNAHYLLGSARLSLGRREDALRAWRTALALQPASAKLMQIMAVEYSAGYYYREGCEVARRAVAIQPDNLNAFLIAIKVCDDGRDSHTLDIARDAVERFPETARTNFEYGFQLRRAGRRDESGLYLQKAIALDPSYEEPYFFYGEMLMIEERYEEAAKNLRAALQIRPDYVVACVSLAKALMALDKLEDAAKEAESCSRTSPTHPQPHLLMSQIQFRLGDDDRASREKELSLKLRRENPQLMESQPSRPFPAAATK